MSWRSTTVFGDVIRSHYQGCLVCYGRNSPFQHDHRTCPTNKADTEAYKKGKRTPAHVREAKVQVSMKLKWPQIFGVSLSLELGKRNRPQTLHSMWTLANAQDVYSMCFKVMISP